MNLRILDKNLNFVGEIDNYSSATIVRKYQDVETITIKLDESKEHSEKLIRGAFVFVDDKYHKFFRIYKRKAITGDGTVKIEAVGKSAMKFLAQRITVPPAGQASETYTAATDDIAKRYIKSACINNADPGMNIGLLTVAAERALGTVLTDETRYKTLSAEVQRLIKIDSLGFKATFNPTSKKAEIEIYKGNDRSQENTEGNPPVIFATKYDNLKSAEIEDSDLNTINYSIVGGKGEGPTRIMATAENGSTAGIDRHCTFVNASSIDDLTELTNKGKEKFSETGLTVDADIETNANQEYEEDYDLGDIVSVAVGNTSIDTRIIEVSEVYSGGARQINVIFGNSPITIKNTISNTNSRLSVLESS